MRSSQNDAGATAARDVAWTRGINAQVESFTSCAQDHKEALRAQNAQECVSVTDSLCRSCNDSW